MSPAAGREPCVVCLVGGGFAFALFCFVLFCRLAGDGDRDSSLLTLCFVPEARADGRPLISAVGGRGCGFDSGP